MSVQVHSPSQQPISAHITLKQQISLKNTSYNNSNEGVQKNATQNTEIINQSSAKQKTINGFIKIFNQINIIDSFLHFVQDLDNFHIQTEQQVSHKSSPQPNKTEQINDDKQPQQLVGQPHNNEIQQLNKTPFFSIHQSPPEKPEPKSVIFDSALEKVMAKNTQALQQMQTNFGEFFSIKKPSQLFETIFSRIINKSYEAFQQISVNISEQLDKNDHFQKEKQKNIQDGNQFMSQQFGSEQKLQEVRKYVNQLKNKQIVNYIKQTQDKGKDIVYFLNLIQKSHNKGLLSFGMETIKRLKIKTPLSSSPNMRDSQNAALSQRISSAQSQRLKSGVSKNSENDDSFNLDLTVKTKNSKNPYQFAKLDSLMYSADSGFGVRMSQSPNKERRADQHSNSSKSVKNNFQDLVKQANEGKKSNLTKSYSQKIQRHENNIKRQLTSKQKIDEGHQIENENDQQNKQTNEFENLQKSDVTAQFPNENDQQKNQKKQQEDVKNVKKKVDTKERSIDGKSSKKIKQKQKNRHSEQRQDENSSIKQDTIVNKLQNFDADDEDQNFKQRQLHQSVNLKKNNSTQHIHRKRVETEVGNKRQLKKQKNNYSIKNIKRFNKLDLSKYQEINVSQKNSRVNSNQGSQANIFTTQINSYHQKISKLKEEKEMKKRLLEKQLAKINYEIKVINQKQEEMSPQSNNYYASRVKISDNMDAQKRAQSLVKNLRSQKRNRNIAKIGQFSSLDKNINDYMEQLTKLRNENEQKTKQKKKLQILERMKQNEMRKINEKKKISLNQQFVLHLKGSNSNNKVQPFKSDLPSKRTPTRNEEEPLVVSPKLEVITPQLNQKKAYLNKIRSFSMKKKQEKDAYEQALD